jgi:hypothetical protein
MSPEVVFFGAPDCRSVIIGGMTIEPQPSPETDLHEMGDGSHLYRVGFWSHQTPPPGSDIPQEQMGFGVEWWDLRAEDVHEVIDWADAKADAEQTYTLFVRFTDPYPPEREWIVRIAGADPTRDPDFDDGFHRQHPRRDERGSADVRAPA